MNKAPENSPKPVFGAVASNFFTKKVFRAYIIFVIICLIAFSYFASPFRVMWSFDHIEQHAKKVITGTELQDWALTILREHPVEPGDYRHLRISELRTPIPKSLLGLYHNPPDIFVYETTTNSPGYVTLMWGGGLIGHCGFEIGPTNFLGRRGTHKWQDGVYFWGE